MFWKKKKPFGKIQLGLDVKRCAECQSYIRPCLADGKPAMFHRWADEDKGHLRINVFAQAWEADALYRRFQDGIIPDGCSVETLRATVALVEYPDGSVGKVKPELIQFLDTKEE